jgi:hypothetical protein
MNLIKGFVTINTYVSNVKNTVSLLGELSTWSQTYSRQKADYVLPAYSNLKLTTFKSIKASDKSYKTLPDIEIKEIFDIINKCIDYNINNIQPYNPDDFRNSINNFFFGKLLNFSTGAFVSNGSISLPQWVSWESIDNSNDNIKIWLSDAAFKDQYDEYEIEVIPPVSDLSLLFGLPAPLKIALDSRSLSQTYELVDTIKAGNPETCVRSLPFTLTNLFTSDTIITNWTAVIYGKAGDQLDNIKEAVTTYVLNNSNKTLVQYQTILPELFRRTEFILVPLWHKKSISNLTELSSLYSSIVSYKDILAFLTNVYETVVYPTGYVAENMAIMPYDFKGISVSIIPGTTNITGKRALSDLFPDYIAVNTSSLDFSRMTVNTQKFVIELGKLLLASESLTNGNILPGNFRQINRNGMSYISMTFDGINYLMATNDNLIFRL